MGNFRKRKKMDYGIECCPLEKNIGKIFNQTPGNKDHQ